MPEFNTGEQKTAIIPVANPTSGDFDYTAILYMGTDLAVMAQVDFHLDAGESKTVSLSIVMPANIGTYPVHLGIFSSGALVRMYQADDIAMVESSLYDLTIDGLQVSINTSLKVVNSVLTVTNHTNQTFIDESPVNGRFRLELHDNAFKAPATDFDRDWMGQILSQGYMPSLAPGTVNFYGRREYGISGNRERLEWFPVLGSRGYIQFNLRALDYAYTPARILASAVVSFTGIFNGQSTIWTFVGFTPPEEDIWGD